MGHPGLQPSSQSWNGQRPHIGITRPSRQAADHSTDLAALAQLQARVVRRFNHPKPI